jgi:hypothetical protein
MTGSRVISPSVVRFVIRFFFKDRFLDVGCVGEEELASDADTIVRSLSC